MDTDGKGFFSSWNDHIVMFKTDKFKVEFDEVINELRGSILKDRSVLASFCYANGESILSDMRSYGFRADTAKHTYLLRLNPNEGEYSLYCYCYVKEYLDHHLDKAKNGIRFITSNYKELFRLPDGGSIRIEHDDGSFDNRTCRYVDDYHLELGNDLYHICELAERLERNDSIAIPMTEPIQTERPKRSLNQER